MLAVCGALFAIAYQVQSKTAQAPPKTAPKPFAPEMQGPYLPPSLDVGAHDSISKKHGAAQFGSEAQAKICFIGHCDATAPHWRISASLLVADEDLGVNIEADLAVITIRPIQHKRQIVAIAKVPMIVSKWTFRFESDAGRAKAMVWLVPGISMPFECGIFEVPHG